MFNDSLFAPYGLPRTLSISSHNAKELSAFPSFGYFVAHNLTSGVDPVIDEVASHVLWRRGEQAYAAALSRFVSLCQARGLIDADAPAQDFACAFLEEIDRQLEGYLGNNWDAVTLLVEGNVRAQEEFEAENASGAALDRLTIEDASSEPAMLSRSAVYPPRSSSVSLVRRDVMRVEHRLALPPLPRVKSLETIDAREVMEVGAANFAWVLRQHSKVLVWFYAVYCPSCKTMRYEYRRAARLLWAKGVCVAQIDGNTHPSLRDEMDVKGYPTVLLFLDGVLHARFPASPELRTADGFVQFVDRQGDLEVVFKTRAHANWERVFLAWLRRKEELRLAGQRAFRTIVDKLIALSAVELGDEGEFIVSQRKGVPEEVFSGSGHVRLCFRSGLYRVFKPHPHRTEPPRLYFFGGGMGAGKSTMTEVLAISPFMQRYGAGVVRIEADAFKMTDPVFQALADNVEDPACLVHAHSVRSAEELFLLAVKDRRDIVFDGTMMWYPFIEQTVRMVRDNFRGYRRGPGYVQGDDGKLETEEYWQVVETYDRPAVPYELYMVGVTIQPHLAVNRGIVRRLTTGRGVPIRAQLRSHRLFSDNFVRYVALFDHITLYDNSHSKPTKPLSLQVIAEKLGKDQELQVMDTTLYDSFLRRQYIREDAESYRALYPVVTNEKDENELDQKENGVPARRKSIVQVWTDYEEARAPTHPDSHMPGTQSVCAFSHLLEKTRQRVQMKQLLEDVEHAKTEAIDAEVVPAETTTVAAGSQGQSGLQRDGGHSISGYHIRDRVRSRLNAHSAHNRAPRAVVGSQPSSRSEDTFYGPGMATLRPSTIAAQHDEPKTGSLCVPSERELRESRRIGVKNLFHSPRSPKLRPKFSRRANKRNPPAFGRSANTISSSPSRSSSQHSRTTSCPDVFSGLFTEDALESKSGCDGSLVSRGKEK